MTEEQVGKYCFRVKRAYPESDPGSDTRLIQKLIEGYKPGPNSATTMQQLPKILYEIIRQERDRYSSNNERMARAILKRAAEIGFPEKELVKEVVSIHQKETQRATA